MRSVIALAALFPAVALGNTINVAVGMNGLAYTPSSVTANVGDILQFTFYPKNHTVSQSTFGTPCVKAVDSATGQQGVDSGFMPVPAGTTVGNPTFAINVTTTSPLWFYCRQTGHCEQGMVFAVNPTPEKTFQAFQAAAIAGGGSTGSPSSGSPSTSTGSPTDGTNPGGIDPATGEPTTAGGNSTEPEASGLPTASGSTTPSTTPNSAASLKVGNAVVIIAALAAGLML